METTETAMKRVFDQWGQWGANIILAVLIFAGAAWVRQTVGSELNNYLRLEVFKEHKELQAETINRMLIVDENLARGTQLDRDRLIRIEAQLEEIKRLLEKQKL